MLKMYSTSLHTHSQPVSETWGSFVNCNHRKLSLSSPETLVGFGWSFHKSLCEIPRYDISKVFKSGQNKMTTAFYSSANSSH